MKRIAISLFFTMTLLCIPSTLTAQTFTMSNGTITGCSGTLLDPGGTGNYPGNTTVVQTICAPNASCIQLNWNLMDMESCCDFINIYDGPSVNSTPLGGYTGQGLPPSISSSGPCITIEFYSDLTTHYQGFSVDISCGACGLGPVATTADCDSSIQVCSATTSFPITANGSGSFNEIPSPGLFGNPLVNPGSTNDGCLQNGELNSTWLIFRIATPGLLEFHFGGPANPQTGFYDWIMYDLTNANCASIAANTIAPVRCNWNCDNQGGTGMAVPLNWPFLATACNYEPPMVVNVNQIFVICFSNWSNANGTVGFNFETGAGNAGVDCSPILSYNDLYLLVDEEEEGNRLTWITQAFQEADQYLVERSVDGGDWSLLANVPAASDHGFTFLDPAPAGERARYRVAMIDQNGFQSYSNEVEIKLPVQDGVNLYPNPVANQLKVRIGQPQQTRLFGQVMDIQGKVVATMEVDALQGLALETQLDIAVLPAGMYFLRINGEVKSFTKARP